MSEDRIPIFQTEDECCGLPVDEEGLCQHRPTHTMMSPAEALRRLVRHTVSEPS